MSTNNSDRQDNDPTMYASELEVSSAAAGKSREREYPAEAENVAYEQGRADESMARADMHRECAQVLEMVSNRLRSLPPPSVEEGGEPEGTAPYTIEHANERGWTEAFMSRRGYVLDDLTGMWLPATTVLSRVRSELTALRKEGEAVPTKAMLEAGAKAACEYETNKDDPRYEDWWPRFTDLAEVVFKAMMTAHPSPAVPEGFDRAAKVIDHAIENWAMTDAMKAVLRTPASDIRSLSYKG